MLQAIETLLALQDRDQRLRTFRSELKAIPLEISSKERLIAESAARLEAAKTRAKAIEVEKKSLELEAATKGDQILRYKTQQMQTRKNEEFTALTHEIANVEGLISVLEDKELALMEEADTLKPQIAEAEKTFISEKAKYEAQIASLREKTQNLSTLVNELDAARTLARQDVDEDLLERYDRLFETKNARAIVPLENEVCTGCHMKVTTQTTLELRAQKNITSCPQCGRLLYLPF